MLQLRDLEVEGFGPFADRQRIEFSADPGVNVVYGENMRGKTSLLSAIRYAFFGTVQGRGSRARALHRISNRARAAEGEYGFEVCLRFHFGDDKYELTRSCKPKSGITIPEEDAHYTQTVILRRNDVVLGPQERQDVLAHVLPEQVARFFLFDGESLQEYEELLHDESEAGRRISEAIERILGVPILKRARAHASTLLDEADRMAARDAAKTKATQDIGKALQQASEQKAAHLQEIERLEGLLTELYEDKREAESYLRSEERHAAILRERDTAQERLAEVKESLESTRTRLQKATRDAWRTVLSRPVQRARSQLQDAAGEDLGAISLLVRRYAVREQNCLACDRPVTSEYARELAKTLPEGAGDQGPWALAPAIERLTQLSAFSETDVTAVVDDLFEQLLRLRIERPTLTARVKDLQTELNDVDVERIRSSGFSLSDVMKKIATYEAALEDERDKVEELASNIQRLTDKLDGTGSPDLRRSQARSLLLRKAVEVFDKAVAKYKAELRERVEKTATAHFRRMTTEKDDYARLAINPSYGLSIVHRDGGTEHDRSAGAEHVVALGLMAALQNNAPLRGPIVMDSPFGRLDEGHTENVIQALPHMAGQVVLLVHEGEIDRERIRELIPTSLHREYELQRESARRTRIVPVTGRD